MELPLLHFHHIHWFDIIKSNDIWENNGIVRDGGKIIIGDVAFKNQDELDVCKKDCGDEWDDDEIYCVADDLKEEFPNLTFEKMTFCSGILMLSR